MATMDELQSVVDGLFANAQELMRKGERQYAAGLLDAMRRIERLIPEKAPAPEPTPQPVLEVVFDELPEGI